MIDTIIIILKAVSLPVLFLITIILLSVALYFSLKHGNKGGFPDSRGKR